MSETKLKIVSVVGARPNFMKAAPLVSGLQQYLDRCENILIHTGQHYDYNLSQLFFEDLKLPDSDIYLGIGSGTHAEQTGNVMIALEKELMKIEPDIVIVFGDINSTLATAVVTSKLGIKLAHVEAGLRSFDSSMPEEINRIVTDRLADYLFVTEPAGVDNLYREGIPSEKIFLVGNIMIDSLKNSLVHTDKSPVVSDLKLNNENYLVLTMHRPSNVDTPSILKTSLEHLTRISRRIPIIFPCHPRTKKMISRHGLNDLIEQSNIRIIDPLGYIDFLQLMKRSQGVITDSGGIQGDTTFLQIPCLTIRKNTEQPITVEIGTNSLCGSDFSLVEKQVEHILKGTYKKGKLPRLWDGQTAGRIIDILLNR